MISKIVCLFLCCLGDVKYFIIYRHLKVFDLCMTIKIVKCEVKKMYWFKNIEHIELIIFC